MQLHPELETVLQSGVKGRYVLSCSSIRCNDLADYRLDNLDTADRLKAAHELSWRRYQGKKSRHYVSIEWKE
jgi:hypothetical protein